MRIGFTGTRHGMTPEQRIRVLRLMHDLDMDVLDHGDCIKADEEAHEIGLTLGASIRVHPPTNDKYRAFCGEEDWSKSRVTVMDPLPYMKRNQEIVDSCAVLIAAPDGFRERLRSGTWSTIRRARKKNRYIAIVYPDGSFGTENRK